MQTPHNNSVTFLLQALTTEQALEMSNIQKFIEVHTTSQAEITVSQRIC